MKKEFMIESPHTKEECLRSRAEIGAMGPKLLARFWWGCNSGDHTGYIMVDAESERQASKMVPTFIRNRAKIVPVEKMSISEIRSLHKM